MTLRLTIAFIVSLFVLGASYAFADGILNDASTTRSRGGVGNYLFWTDREMGKEEKNELVNSERRFEDEPGYLGEELSTHQASAVAPTQIVLFDTGSAHLDTSGNARLSEIASTLKSDPSLKIEITGFTDNEGSESENVALARSRAQTVVRKLEARGVSDSQMNWSAMGEREPIDENDTPEGRAQNRRVEIQFE